MDYPEIISAFSKKPGNMSLVYGDTAQSLENRREFLNSLNIDYRHLACAKQVHGSGIRQIKNEDRGRGAEFYDTSVPGTDALITNVKNLPLAVFTADCLCVFLYDAASASIGIVHAGWRSSKDNIVTKAIRLMQEKFNTRPQNLSAGFGPALRQCCYEVGEEFNSYFPDNLSKKNNRFYLDLVGLNRTQLLNAGVKEARIFDCGICTSCCNDEYFSFRKEGSSCGRTLSVIMLK